ncbi:MAG: DnaJ domain-containing protein [Azospirillaceae bacterium]
MIPSLVLGVFLLAGLLLIANWFVEADPKDLARFVKRAAIVVGVLVVVFLAVTGRLGPALAGLAFLLPVIFRWRGLLRRMKTARGPTPGQRSGLSTATLEVELDHDTGAMDGTVRRGPFEGWRLGDLSQAELLRLLADCRREDPQSISVLEAYLDRRFGPDWRAEAEGEAPGGAGTGGAAGAGSGAGGSAGSRGGRMSREEALDMLGLEEGADADQIKDAHRRLMKKFHPDHGGTDYLAAKLNEAKAVLLGDR